MTDEKILDKLGKLKAMAEGAKAIGSEAEAQAFAEMLQKLLFRYNLAMSDVEMAEHREKEPVRQFLVDWQDVRVRSHRVGWMEDLAVIIAKAHFCRIVVHRKSSRLTLVGRASNVKIAEYLLVTMTRFIEHLSEKEEHENYLRLKAQYKEQGKRWDSPHRGFRTAYRSAFMQRLKERFEEERKAQEAGSVALVRFNQEDQALKDYFKAKHESKEFRKAGLVRGARTDANAEGHRRGRKAADGMQLRANAVEEGPKELAKLLRF